MFFYLTFFLSHRGEKVPYEMYFWWHVLFIEICRSKRPCMPPLYSTTCFAMQIALKNIIYIRYVTFRVTSWRPGTCPRAPGPADGQAEPSKHCWVWHRYQGVCESNPVAANALIWQPGVCLSVSHTIMVAAATGLGLIPPVVRSVLHTYQVEKRFREQDQFYFIFLGNKRFNSHEWLKRITRHL